MEKKMYKTDFIETAIMEIQRGNKLALVKLVKDTSRNSINDLSIGLKECKEFVDEHYVATEENAELLWKFAKGKLK